MILLDTCTLLWLAADQSQLSDKAIDAISKSNGLIYVSSISAFEIAIKVKKKKLQLKGKASTWFDLALNLHGITEISTSAEIFLEAVNLPEHHHDPADRIIIATAKLNNLTLITPDQHIKRYRSIKTVW